MGPRRSSKERVALWVQSATKFIFEKKICSHDMFGYRNNPLFLPCSDEHVHPGKTAALRG